MGLQGHLNDVASDSLPIYFVALFASCFKHLRSFLALFSSGSSVDFDAYSLFGSGLNSLVFLSDQLSLNLNLSYIYTANDNDSGRVTGPECVFCLSGLNNGDLVRKLSCCHVFHKICLDGWLNEMKFNCPLCRSPLTSDDGDELIG